MIFGNPKVLWLLPFFCAALLAFFWWSLKKRAELMTQFIQARLLPGLLAGISPVRRKIRFGCIILAVASLIVALARPQWGFIWQEVKQRGVDVVVAIDTSKSMLATDIAPNRLARAKLAALDLMLQSKSDRLGLVAFAGNAFLQCPLTIDDVAFRQSVESLNVNSIPQGGTALADAIDTALTAFKEGDSHKVLVLMTDGEDHDSGALEAAKRAAAAGLRIYTIGIGTGEGELLRIKDAQGNDDYVRDEQGNVVKSHLNERLLQEIASASEGGFYLPLRGAKTIETLYREGLAKGPQSEHQEKLVKQYQERYQWPLGLAIVLLVLEALLPERRRETTNLTGSEPASPKLVTALLLFLLVLPATLRASPGSALRQYKAGKYDQALKEYEALIERKKDDPRLHFNAGAAAYREGKFDDAAQQFSQAIASPDLKLQQLAYYNVGNALYYAGEHLPDPQKRTEAWEKAAKNFELSLKLNPQDADAKFNLEFVKKKLEELKQQQQKQKDQSPPPQPSEAAKKAKAEADAAVRRREYTQALQIMERQLAQDSTTSYYSDFINRLKEVTGVQANVNH